MIMVYMAKSAELTVDSQQEGPCAVVRAAGELDIAAVPWLRLELDRALAASRPPCLVLNLTEVTFCDSYGLDLLIQTFRRVRDAGGRMIIVTAPGVLSRLLMITNLDRRFETRPTVAAAQAALTTAA
jgi:anti-sigma B factor antagonist